MLKPPFSDALAGLTLARWDQLARDRFYSSGSWLRYCAASGSEPTGALLTEAADGALAAVPVSEVTAPEPGLYNWNQVLADCGLPEIAGTGLLVASPQGYQTHLLADRGAADDASVSGLIDQARLVRDGLGSPRDKACVLMYVTTQDALTARRVGAGSLPILTDADAWFSLGPGGWEEWLGSLTSKRRRSVKRETRRFEETGYRITHRPLSECYQQIGVLARLTQARYGFAQDAEFFVGLLKAHVDNMGDAARVAVCARPNEDPTGFCLYYIWGDTLFGRWAGFDYDRCCNVAEYFNLCYYTHIRSSAETGIRRIHAGIKAPEAKAHRGARLEPLWMIDLDNDGVLARGESDIRAHNRRLWQQHRDDAVTAAATAAADGWDHFM